MLDMYTTQGELEAQWRHIEDRSRQGDLEKNIYALARFAEARAIVAARKIIAEKDKRIAELEAHHADE